MEDTEHLKKLTSSALIRLYYKNDKENSTAEEKAKARECLRLAIIKGDATAYRLLAKVYEREEDIDKYYPIIVDLYKKAGLRGDEFAYKNLTTLGLKYYREDEYKKQDFIKAKECFEIAAKYGDNDAQHFLGKLYEKVENNYEEAFKWYKISVTQSAEVRNLLALNELGLRYSEKYNLNKANECFNIVRKKAPAVEKYAIGFKYFIGDKVEKNYREAKIWFKKAAEQGIAIAKTNLGILYEEGKGVEQDYTEAVMWYQKAVKQGEVLAHNFLAQLYEEGKGVEQDYEKALIWYQKAAKQGYNKAKIRVNYLKRFTESLKTKSIKIIHDISEIWNLELKSETCNFEAIQVDPGEDNDRYAQSHTLYSIEDIKKIMDVVKSILSDVDRVQNDKKNEIDVFMQIYVKLAKLISYDCEYKTKPYTSANMIGGLLKQECVCARVCRNIKKSISL